MIFILTIGVRVLTQPVHPSMVQRRVIEEFRHLQPQDWPSYRREQVLGFLEKRIVWLVLGATIAGFVVLYSYAGVPAHEFN